MQANNWMQAFEFVYQHLALVGYGTFGYFVWRVSRTFTRVSDTAEKAVKQIDTMSTEHFPAMKTSLESQDRVLTSMDGSLKTLVQGQVQFVTAKPVRRRSRKK